MTNPIPVGDFADYVVWTPGAEASQPYSHDDDCPCWDCTAHVTVCPQCGCEWIE